MTYTVDAEDIGGNNDIPQACLWHVIRTTKTYICQKVNDIQHVLGMSLKLFKNRALSSRVCHRIELPIYVMDMSLTCH
jgi:hypothetical protein